MRAFEIGLPIHCLLRVVVSETPAHVTLKLLHARSDDILGVLWQRGTSGRVWADQDARFFWCPTLRDTACMMPKRNEITESPFDTNKALIKTPELQPRFESIGI